MGLILNCKPDQYQFYKSSPKTFIHTDLIQYVRTDVSDTALMLAVVLIQFWKYVCNRTFKQPFSLCTTNQLMHHLRLYTMKTIVLAWCLYSTQLCVSCCISISATPQSAVIPVVYSFTSIWFTDWIGLDYGNCGFNCSGTVPDCLRLAVPLSRTYITESYIHTSAIWLEIWNSRSCERTC